MQNHVEVAVFLRRVGDSLQKMCLAGHDLSIRVNVPFKLPLGGT